MTTSIKSLTSLCVWAALLFLGIGSARAEDVPSGVPGMIFERDVAVTMSDGLQLRANVYRPEKEGRYPVVMLHGPYGKDTHLRDVPGYYGQVWAHMTEDLPQLCQSSSCRFIRFEAPDPELWVPDGYIIIHADSRGSGKSPGFMAPNSPRQMADYSELITWASKQPWSNGKIGLLGISYYSANQWNVAAMQPEGLAAIIPWEATFDRYRDGSLGYHGGIPAGWAARSWQAVDSRFDARDWYERQLIPVQHGNGDSPYRDAITGERVTGPALSPAILEGNRANYSAERVLHPLDDAWFAERNSDGSRIKVPLLSVGNWGNLVTHQRGNIEGYLRAASENKWLRMTVGDHVQPFYREESVAVQKRFFDRYLKGLDNGWESEAPLTLAIRHPDKVVERGETSWPLAGTEWTRYFLDTKDMSLSLGQPAESGVAEYQAMSNDLTFTTEAFAEDAEFTGPVKLKLWVRSSTSDMDIFAAVRLLRPDGTDVAYTGPAGQDVPVSLGWLRTSHRELDEARSTEYRPYHTHRNPQPMTPGELYEVDVEIMPTSVVVPAGYRLAVTIGGKDWYPVGREGPDRHPGRDAAIYGGTNGIAAGPGQASYILLPLIPSDRNRVASR
jgi:putative CocE/NonD family hydrolase